MRSHGFSLLALELAAQRAAAVPIVPVDDPNPRYPRDMSMGEIERSIRVSAEHFGHIVPVEIGEGAARRLRELVEAPEPAPDRVVPPGWERAAYAEPWPPAFHAPPRGRVVSQATGPNRAADRARGIYGKRGKK